MVAPKPQDWSSPFSRPIYGTSVRDYLWPKKPPPPWPPKSRSKPGSVWLKPSGSPAPAPVMEPRIEVEGVEISNQSPYYVPASYCQWLFRTSHVFNLDNDGTEQTVLEFQVPAGAVLVVRKLGFDAPPFGKLDILWRWYGGSNGFTPLFEYQPGKCLVADQGSPTAFYCNEIQPESLNETHIVIPTGGKFRITATGQQLNDGGVERPTVLPVFASFAGWYFSDPSAAPTSLDPVDPFINDWVDRNWNPEVETVETATVWAWQEIWSRLRDPRPPLEVDLLYYGGLINWASAQPSDAAGNAVGPPYLMAEDPFGEWY